MPAAAGRAFEQRRRAAELELAPVVPIADEAMLEQMGELAAWQATLPERSRYGIVQALRQTLAAAVRWDYMSPNPAKLAGRNPEPSPRPVRA